MGRMVKEETRKERLHWLQTNTKRPYRIENLKTNKVLFSIRKLLARRFFQLKLDHVVTAQYLNRIGKIESKSCWWCTHSNQTISYLLFECRHWRPQRRTFCKELVKEGIGVSTMAELDPKIDSLTTRKNYNRFLTF